MGRAGHDPFSLHVIPTTMMLFRFGAGTILANRVLIVIVTKSSPVTGQEKPMNALFDFSFTKFLAPKVVGILYGIGIFFVGLTILILVGASFQKSAIGGLMTLLFSPVLFLLYVVMLRIGLEGLVSTIKVAENSQAILQQMQTMENPNRLQ
jgi:cytochrome c oxidase assembly factor CtaG